MSEWVKVGIKVGIILFFFLIFLLSLFMVEEEEPVPGHEEWT
ncbi:MAG: hypothetical protein QXG39_03365 [Candidatus Aenigmatarchaeota archaeon]